MGACTLKTPSSRWRSPGMHPLSRRIAGMALVLLLPLAGVGRGGTVRGILDPRVGPLSLDGRAAGAHLHAPLGGIHRRRQRAPAPSGGWVPDAHETPPLPPPLSGQA